jgi:hypothetical protein
MKKVPLTISTVESQKICILKEIKNIAKKKKKRCQMEIENDSPM